MAHADGTQYKDLDAFKTSLARRAVVLHDNCDAQILRTSTIIPTSSAFVAPANTSSLRGYREPTMTA